MPRDRRRVMLEAGYKLNINGMKLRPNCHIDMVWRYGSGLLLRGHVRTGPQQGTVILSFGDTRQWIELT